MDSWLPAQVCRACSAVRSRSVCGDRGADVGPECDFVDFGGGFGVVAVLACLELGGGFAMRTVGADGAGGAEHIGGQWVEAGAVDAVALGDAG
jgi:hypothetical protein